MPDAKVSVIIPFYNASKYLRQTIQSVLDQRYNQLEIILVDDGSDDKSVDIVKSFLDPRIHYVFQKNKGAAAARNTGLKVAGGDLIQFLDGDDLIHPDKILMQVEVLRNSQKGTIATCSWSKFENDPAEAIIVPEKVWQDYDRPEDWLVDSWLGGGMMQTACWMVSKEVLDKVGPWREDLTLHDDGEYFTRVVLHSSNIIFISDALVYYRQVAKSLSRLRSHKAIKSAYHVSDLSTQYLLQQANHKYVKPAAARHLGKFAYEFYGEDKELASLALDKVQKLYSSRKLKVGTDKFNVLVSIVGLRKALQLKYLLKKMSRSGGNKLFQYAY